MPGILEDLPDRRRRHHNAQPCESPWMRRSPHASFCRASRSTTDRTLRCVPRRPLRDNRARRRRTMSRCQRKTVAGVTISRFPASHGRQRPGENGQPRPVRPRQPGRSPRPFPQGDSQLVPQHEDSASFHHDSRRHKPSSDTTRDTMRKMSFKPTSRRSSHPQQGQHRPAPRRTQRGIRPGGAGFRHLRGGVASVDRDQRRGKGLVHAVAGSPRESRPRPVRRAAMARAVWLFTAPQLMPIAAATSASEKSA